MNGGHIARHYETRGCVMKKFFFWFAFVNLVLFILSIFLMLIVENHVPVGRDIANAFTVKKAAWTVPVLNGAMLPVQCSGLGKTGQWVCANYYWGSAASTLDHKDVWGKRVGENPCAFFRAHLRSLELTEFDSPSNWKAFKIGLAACETV